MKELIMLSLSLVVSLFALRALRNRIGDTRYRLLAEDPLAWVGFLLICIGVSTLLRRFVLLFAS